MWGHQAGKARTNGILAYPLADEDKKRTYCDRINCEDTQLLNQLKITKAISVFRMALFPPMVDVSGWQDSKRRVEEARELEEDLREGTSDLWGSVLPARQELGLREEEAMGLS